MEFVPRELGPSTIRLLNTSLTRMLSRSGTGLVSLLQVHLVKLYQSMIKGGKIGNEDLNQSNLTSEQLECLDDPEELKWKAHSKCYSAKNWRKRTGLQKLVLNLCVYAYGDGSEEEKMTVAECVLENSTAPTENRYYKTYQEVYDGWMDEILMDLKGLPDSIVKMGREERMECYATQLMKDSLHCQERYEASKMNWFLTNKVVPLSNILTPKIFAKVLLQLWKILMETSLQLLLPTWDEKKKDAGIPYWNSAKKGMRPMKMKKKKMKKKRKKVSCLPAYSQ